MTNTLKLTEKQEYFLEENRNDPITGDSFSLGDTIVFCAECKSAFLKESWEYIGSKHCHQKRTLKSFPFTSTLKIKKRKIINYEKAGIGNRFGAYMSDVIIGFVIATIVNFIITKFRTDNYTVSLFTFSIYMLFRDIFTLKGSLGKKIFGLYFTSSKRESKPIYIQILLRNLIYWIPVSIFYLLFDKETRDKDFLDTIFMICFVITIFFNVMLYPIFLITDKKSLIDNLLKITLLQKKEF